MPTTTCVVRTMANWPRISARRISSSREIVGRQHQAEDDLANHHHLGRDPAMIKLGASVVRRGDICVSQMEHGGRYRNHGDTNEAGDA